MMKTMTTCLMIGSVLISFMLSNCGGGGGSGGSDSSDSTATSEMSEGETVYRSKVASGNNFTCATCHALEEPAEDGIRRAGHAIGNATRRSFYKNGRLGSMLEAANSCLEEWMVAEPWTEESVEWQALYSWLDEQATVQQDELVEISLTSVPEDLSGGDASAGKELFNASCSICHGTNGVGTEVAPQVGGLGLSGEYVARRVRTSGSISSSVYEGLTGGVMPFWGADRLSDDELRNIIAYLAIQEDEIVILEETTTTTGITTTTTTGITTTTSISSETTTTTSSSSTTLSSTSPTTGCTSTHTRVGQVAVLSEKFHGVSGTATIQDDCTIVLTNFNYDGKGIVVKVYGGTNGIYDPTLGAFAIGDDFASTVYNNATLSVTLPSDKTLSDLDGISIWCVSAKVSFGDGLFSAP